MLFVYRGFGVAAGTHAFYDIFIGVYRADMRNRGPQDSQAFGVKRYSQAEYGEKKSPFVARSGGEYNAVLAPRKVRRVILHQTPVAKATAVIRGPCLCYLFDPKLLS